MQPTPTASPMQPTQPAQRNDVMWPNAQVQPTEPVAPVQQAPYSPPPTKSYYVDTSAERQPGSSAT